MAVEQRRAARVEIPRITVGILGREGGLTSGCEQRAISGAGKRQRLSISWACPRIPCIHLKAIQSPPLSLTVPLLIKQNDETPFLPTTACALLKSPTSNPRTGSSHTFHTPHRPTQPQRTTSTTQDMNPLHDSTLLAPKPPKFPQLTPHMNPQRQETATQHNPTGQGAWLSWKSAGLIRLYDPAPGRDILRS